MPWLLGISFVIAGLVHFIAPQSYVAIMPAFLPWPKVLVALSGVAEILGGVGVCLPLVSHAAAWGLIALLVCVFPANIHALSTGMVIAGHALPLWLLWLRLPLQPLLIAWVYYACLRERR